MKSITLHKTSWTVSCMAIATTMHAGWGQEREEGGRREEEEEGGRREEGGGRRDPAAAVHVEVRSQTRQLKCATVASASANAVAPSLLLLPLLLPS